MESTVYFLNLLGERCLLRKNPRIFLISKGVCGSIIDNFMENKFISGCLTSKSTTSFAKFDVSAFLLIQVEIVSGVGTVIQNYSHKPPYSENPGLEEF